ncbi:tripartite tricarboxylate transporter TctB family protein, partial [Thermodesulfobacteriota bacterium]
RQEIEEGAREGIKIFYAIVLMFVFLFLMMVFGFTAGTFIFLLFSCWSLGYKNKTGLVISCIVVTGFMYLLFILIMKSFLPEGLIFDVLRG